MNMRIQLGRRLGLITLMLLAGTGAAPHDAAALSACFADAVGPWRGPVLNGSGTENMTTMFSLGVDGTLTGSYHVEDIVPLDGTLTDFRETGICSGEFRWHDRDGGGVVRILFQPELGRFLGQWGFDRPTPGNVFNGYRRLAPTS